MYASWIRSNRQKKNTEDRRGMGSEDIFDEKHTDESVYPSKNTTLSFSLSHSLILSKPVNPEIQQSHSTSINILFTDDNHSSSING